MKSIFRNILLYCCPIILICLFVVITILNQSNERIDKLEKEVEFLRIAIEQKDRECKRLDSLYRVKDVCISLDITGIPPRKGGGVVVNNVLGEK